MNFQKKVLAAIIQTDDVVDRFEKVDFSRKHFNKGNERRVFRAIKDIREEDDEVTNFSLKKYFDLKISDEEKAETIKSFVDKLSEADISGVQFTLSELEDSKRKQNLVRSLKGSTHKIREGQSVDEVLEDISDDIKDLSKNKFDYEIIDYWDSFEERKIERRQLQEESDRTLSMVQNLEPFKEPYLRRGIPEETITAIIGNTGTGKSVLLSNFVYVSVHPANSLNTLMVVSENRKIEATSRMDAIMLKENYEDLYEMKVTNDEHDSFFRSAKRKDWGFFKVVKVEPNAYDANTIREIIERVEDKYGFRIQVVALDSFDLQEPVGNYNQFWEERKAVAYDTKQLVDDLNLIYLGTAQAKPRAKGKDNVRNEDVAGAQDLTRVSDNVCFINSKTDDHLLNRGNFEFTKVRDGDLTGRPEHFYHHESKRLIPWHEKFSNVDPESDADEVIKGIKKMRADNFNEDPNSFNLKE